MDMGDVFPSAEKLHGMPFIVSSETSTQTAQLAPLKSNL